MCCQKYVVVGITVERWTLWNLSLIVLLYNLYYIYIYATKITVIWTILMLTNKNREWRLHFLCRYFPISSEKCNFEYWEYGIPSTNLYTCWAVCTCCHKGYVHHWVALLDNETNSRHLRTPKFTSWTTWDFIGKMHSFLISLSDLTWEIKCCYNNTIVMMHGNC